MNEHEEIAKALKARLSELRTHLAKIDRELHKPLPADSEDQAIELLPRIRNGDQLYGSLLML